MKRLLTITAITAALGVTGYWASTTWADKASEVQLPAGNTAVSADVVKDIQKTLGKVVGLAVNKGDFNRVIGYLTKEDQNRLVDYKKIDTKDLDGRISQILDDWKSKYNERFDLNQAEVVFQNLGLQYQQDKLHVIASLDSLGHMHDMNKDMDKDYNRGDINRGMDKARDNAAHAAGNAMDKMGHMMGHNQIQLLNEDPGGNSWRINIPDTMTAQQLHDNLLNHLTKLDQNKANWPADKNMAYREVAYHVLQAFSSRTPTGEAMEK